MKPARNGSLTQRELEVVLAEQDAYREAGPAVVSRAVRAIARPMAALTSQLIPTEVVEAALRGADWAASTSIRRTAVSHDFADLAACDAAAAEVRRWALGYAATGGGAAGAFGALGLAIDIPTTVTLALRTVRLTGLCYGFGGDGQAERIYILDVLQLAGANSIEERDEALARLAQERNAFAKEDWQKIVQLTGQTTASVTTIQRVAATLGVNLSTRKVAQLTPVFGAAIGAGVNMAFQNDVASAARFSYRARWLQVNEGIIEGHLADAADASA